jgi:hypothetical protein
VIWTYFGRLHLCTGRDDLCLTSSLRLSSHGQRILEILRKDDVLDKHRLDFDTPTQRSLLDNLADRLSNLLTTLNHILQHTCTDNMTQRRLCTLDKCLADVADAEGGLVRRRDAVVNDGRKLQRDIVLGHADLLGDLDDLDLDVDLHKLLGERVDVDETGVDGAGEAAEFGHETYVSLVHGLIGIRANDAAGDCAEGTDAATKSVNLEVG